jgi:3-phenylpropionate/trans-cinnamate dioxygenase ferredoxin subunit
LLPGSRARVEEVFVKVGSLREFTPGSVRGVEVDGTRIVIANAGGRLYALSNACPHVGLPMSGGYLHESAIVCPFHGSFFKLDDGEPIGGPATDALEVYEVRVEGDDVLVSRQ